MAEEFTISWMDILPDKRLDETVPYVVIKDLTILCGVSLNDVIQNRKSGEDIIEILKPMLTKSITFTLPLHTADIPKCINFLNPCYSRPWSVETLEDSLRWVHTFSALKTLPRGLFYYGFQSPIAPRGYNSIMLYRLLSDRKAPVDYNITTQQMSRILMFLLNNTERGRDIIYNSILAKMDTNQLIKMYTYGTTLIDHEASIVRDIDGISTPERGEDINTPEQYDGIQEVGDNIYSDIERVSERLRDREYIMERIHPNSAAEAVTLAAKIYAKDISMAKEPISEYLHLRRKVEYIPKDEGMRQIYSINHMSFNLDVNFNVNLPEGLYKQSSLRTMALKEGYTTSEIDDESAYSLLQLSHFSNTFYHGRQPYIINETTLADEDRISELHNNVIICFGRRCTIGVNVYTYPKTMYAFRYSDLARYFRTEGYFRNPIIYPIDGMVLFDNPGRRGFFDEVSIRKLKMLCDDIYVDDIPDYIEERKDLLNAIEEVELLNDVNIRKMGNFRTVYSLADEPTQKLIRGTINKLLELAMMMRGWSGKEEDSYPISTAIHDEDVIIALRVTATIMELEADCVQLADIGTLFMDLPLYIYEDGSFIPSSEDKLGKTILQRLNIVKKGEDHSDVNSCIKMSSGWFMCTAYHIASVLGLPPLFNIEDFQDIS